ncbi:MAG: hypothetical protein B7Y39_07335 [Bdellovibrio sp. 28-41-41]|nr:MAG: hypothetical protein B7Y39_07335 [Bdellovibrio sp. 28-41-41]
MSFKLGLTAVLLSSSFAFAQTGAKSEYTKSTYFEPGEGIVFPNLELEYALDPKLPNQLRVGNAVFNQKTFLIELKGLHRLDPAFKGPLSQKNDWALVLHWPKQLFPNPEIEIISGTGKSVWKKPLTESDLKSWQDRNEAWKKKLGTPKFNPTVLNSSFGLIGGSEVNRLRGLLASSFKFCVFAKTSKGDSRYCSPLMEIRKGKKLFAQNDLKNRVLIQNEEAKPEGIVKTDPLMPATFYAEFGLGGSYEFKTDVPKPDFADIAEINDTTLKLTGFGVKPNMPVRIITKDEISDLTRFFGFESTIKNDREFWEITIPKTESYIYFPGPAGGLFRQVIVASEVPKAKSRIWVHGDTPTSIYGNEIAIKALKPQGANVESDQNSIAPGATPREFVWNFRADKKGELNKSYLTVTQGGKTFTSFYEIYRSQPNEISGRFTGVLANSGQIILGEVSYNRWFESLLGRNSFSFQRWGLNLRYFKSFSPLFVSDAQKENLTSLIGDIKYRFTPGVWTRDASMGIMFGYQDIVFGDFNATMAGGGWFWARSMPRVLDNIFNWVPFMRYPKWVDVEVIYYFSPLKSNITLNSPFSVNFHGQILWSKSFFGEAGFGLKRYAFIDKTLNQEVELNTFYGTVGLGVKF